MERIYADCDCPECGNSMLYDINESPNKGGGIILVTFYCENDGCDYYTAGYINVVEEIVNKGGVLW